MQEKNKIFKANLKGLSEVLNLEPNFYSEPAIKKYPLLAGCK
jgi:hypothetical protein